MAAMYVLKTGPMLSGAMNAPAVPSMQSLEMSLAEARQQLLGHRTWLSSAEYSKIFPVTDNGSICVPLSSVQACLRDMLNLHLMPEAVAMLCAMYRRRLLIVEQEREVKVIGAKHPTLPYSLPVIVYRVMSPDGSPCFYPVAPLGPPPTEAQLPSRILLYAVICNEVRNVLPAAQASTPSTGADFHLEQRDHGTSAMSAALPQVCLRSVGGMADSLSSLIWWLFNNRRTSPHRMKLWCTRQCPTRRCQRNAHCPRPELRPNGHPPSKAY